MQSQSGSKRRAGGVSSVVAETIALTDIVGRGLLSREVCLDPSTRVGSKQKSPKIAVAAVKQDGGWAAFGTARNATKKVLSIHNGCGAPAHRHPDDCRELGAANGLATNDLSTSQGRVTSLRISHHSPSSTTKKRIGRHDATTISPNFFRQLARRRPSGSCLRGALCSDQGRIRREDACEERLLANNVGQSATSVGAKSRDSLIVPTRAGPKPMMSILDCKHTIGTQFAAMNPAGGN
jgi:hypothetical protein